MNKPLPHFTKGDLLKADDLMAIRAAIIRQRLKTGSNSGIILSETPNGTQIRATNQGRRGSVALTGSIAARVAHTPGAGTVRLYDYNPTTNLLVDSSVDQVVKNFSASAIPAGKYCWVEEDDGGTWWIVSVEC